MLNWIGQGYSGRYKHPRSEEGQKEFHPGTGGPEAETPEASFRTLVKGSSPCLPFYLANQGCVRNYFRFARHGSTQKEHGLGSLS